MTPSRRWFERFLVPLGMLLAVIAIGWIVSFFVKPGSPGATNEDYTVNTISRDGCRWKVFKYRGEKDNPFAEQPEWKTVAIVHDPHCPCRQEK